MYGLYNRRQHRRRIEFSLTPKDAHLFGKNRGWIPWLLEETHKNASEPLKWHLPIHELVNEWEPGCSLLINLKPKDRALHFYELVHAWGHCSNGWTPIMLCLVQLHIDTKSTPCESGAFTCRRSNEMCFSTNYLNGTIQSGKLEGTWSPPRPSSTNGVLLWPETLEYFANEAANTVSFA